VVVFEFELGTYTSAVSLTVGLIGELIQAHILEVLGFYALMSTRLAKI